jgi:methionine sulfoxide reductase heme-binding subunit
MNEGAETDMLASLWPWVDRTGRFSWLRLGVFLVLIAPAFWILVQAFGHMLGPRPVTSAIHQTGQWAVRFLAATLAVTPLRNATRFARLASIRRMLGLSVLCYAIVHLFLYGLDQHGNLPHIASEIVRRIYLTIGFVALCGLLALGITSTDGMIRRLGAQRWSQLHKIVYGIAILGAIHFFLQSKLDKTEPIIMAGIFALLFCERIARRLFGDLTVFGLAAVTAVAAAATAFGEAAWYSFKTGAPILMIVSANLDFSYTVRPAWFVVGAGLLLMLARLFRPLVAPRPGRIAQRLRAAAAE